MEQSPLVRQVLSGSNRQLMLLAAQGILPIAPSDLVYVQVQLASKAEDEVAEQAKKSLAELDRSMVAPMMAEDADATVLRYFAANSRDGEVLDAILRRREVPTDVLLDLAPRLPADLQETLLLRQDRISAEPALLEALEANQGLTAFSRRKISEYRQHLLVESAPVVIPVEEPEKLTEASDEEVQEALDQVRSEPPEGEIDEQTGLSDGQIRLLPIPVRLKLTRGASKSLRAVLIRDNNVQVALAVLDGNPVGDQEIERITRSRTVLEEVLEYIARQRRWVSKYQIMMGLATNPRTPAGISVKLIPRMSVRDLRNLSRDRNVPEAVRNTARRIYRVKSQ